jgi:hypothetical protein
MGPLFHFDHVQLTESTMMMMMIRGQAMIYQGGKKKTNQKQMRTTLIHTCSYINMQTNKTKVLNKCHNNEDQMKQHDCKIFISWKRLILIYTQMLVTHIGNLQSTSYILSHIFFDINVITLMWKFFDITLCVPTPHRPKNKVNKNRYGVVNMW